jgi:gas vesicle protein
MKALRLIVTRTLILFILAGIVAMPAGADNLVLPGPDKPFEQFQVDDAACRQWAAQRTGQQPQDAARDTTIQGSIIGTLLGAGLGAAIGAAAGDPGIGAAIGAGSGLLLGTVSGTESGRQSGYVVQNRIDIAYQQCMYAKGNYIPGVPVRQVPPPVKPQPSTSPGSHPANDRYDPPYPYPTRD